MRALLAHWRYEPTAHTRDLRIDLIRGYLVFVMTISHLGTYPAWTQVLTGGTRLWITAPFGFVLISGIVLGMLYQTRTKLDGWNRAICKVGQRSLQLYGLAVLGQIVLTTIDYLLRLFINRPSDLPINYLELLESALLQIRYAHPAYHLLPLFALLLPWGLAVVYLLKNGHWKWIIIGSILLWRAQQLEPQSFMIFHAHFQFARWQFLYTIGVLLGFYRNRISRRWSHLPLPRWTTSTLLVGSALALLAINYRIAFHGLWENRLWWASPQGLPFDCFQIIFTIWVFGAFYELFTWCWKPIARLIGWLMLPLGQNSLIAYMVQGFLSYLAFRLPGHPFPGHDPTIMGFLHIAAVLLVWVITRAITESLKQYKKSRSHAIIPGGQLL